MDCPSCGTANPVGRDSVAIAERRCRPPVPRAALRTPQARDFAATVVLHWPKPICTQPGHSNAEPTVQ